MRVDTDDFVTLQVQEKTSYRSKGNFIIEECC